MQWYEIIYTVVVSILGSFLAAGGYMLQRDRYWRRTWEHLGKPQISCVKELKALSREHEQAEISPSFDESILGDVENEVSATASIATYNLRKKKA
jgi:hypothetical protein